MSDRMKLDLKTRCAIRKQACENQHHLHRRHIDSGLVLIILDALDGCTTALANIAMCAPPAERELAIKTLDKYGLR